jgi:GNAT superfamily N-acetyltransferase
VEPAALRPPGAELLRIEDMESRVSPSLTIRQLTEFDRTSLERHFLLLGAEDRRLRFGMALPDIALRGYVERIDLVRDAVFAATDDDLAIVAAAHLAHNGSDGELGLSVLPPHRARGLGSALLTRAHTHARNLGLRVLFVHCLAENGAMMHIARRDGMRIVAQDAEADAFLELEPADTVSRVSEALEQAVALFDYALRSPLRGPRAIARAMTSGRGAPSE